MTPFAQLCLLLRCALGTEARPARALAETRFDVPLVAALAFRHRIAAFLRGLAVDPELGPLLPAELADCFVFAHEENGRRNRALREELAGLLGLLNARGIAPVLLKGASRLVDGVYPDPADRFMQDLDLLVPPPSTEAAAAALLEAGYAFSERGQRLAHEFHHLPSLRREGSIAEIELHRSVLSHWNERRLSTAEVVAGATRRAVAGGRAALPGPAQALAHLILHGQLQHHRMLIGGVLLAEALEAVLLTRRFGAGLAEEVAEEARARGYGLACDVFLRASEMTTGEALRAPSRPGLLVEGLARRSVLHQEHGFLKAPGRALVWVSGSAMTLVRYPSMTRRFPGRLVERDFYAARWRELRNIFPG